MLKVWLYFCFFVFLGGQCVFLTFPLNYCKQYHVKTKDHLNQADSTEASDSHMNWKRITVCFLDTRIVKKEMTVV